MVWSKGAALASLLAGTQEAQPKVKTIGLDPVARTVQYRPRSIEEKTAEQFNSAGALHNLVDSMGTFSQAPDPEYDWAAKAEKLAAQIARYKNMAAIQRSHNSQISAYNSVSGPGSVVVGGVPNNRLGSFIRAIAGQESGGNYGAVNSSSGAMGKYQIMPANITGQGSGWDMEALGRDITAQEFLHNPKLQEKIARYKLQQYFNQYGARGAASAWYSGDPNKYKNNSPQGGYPSVAEYVAAIIRRMHGG